MNILILSTHLNTGGITSYILTLVKNLYLKGHNVFVVTSGGDKVPELESLGIQHMALDIQTKSELNPKIYLALFKLAPFIKKNRIDIIHAHTRVTQIMASFLGRLTKRPYVTTCHGFFKRKLFRELFPCWGKGTIAISEAVYKHLRDDFHQEESKLGLIHNGVDVTEFPFIDDEFKKINKRKFNLKSGLTLGIIARLSDVKGHDVLIKAMKRIIRDHLDVSLLIVGQGKMDGELRALVKSLNLENHIRFHPVVHKTSEVLALLDIFVMPSRQEGLGLSIMEAQAAGLAVVASRVGGIPSLIEHGKTGILVQPGDEEELADAIISLLNDQKKRLDLGQNAREFIRQEFSSEKMTEKTLAFYGRFVTSQ